MCVLLKPSTLVVRFNHAILALYAKACCGERWGDGGHDDLVVLLGAVAHTAGCGDTGERWGDGGHADLVVLLGAVAHTAGCGDTGERGPLHSVSRVCQHTKCYKICNVALTAEFLLPLL